MRRPGILTELGRLAEQFRSHGLRLTLLAGADKLARWVTGGPLARYSHITDALWLGGQPSPRGVRRLFALGFTGFINLRSEHDYSRLVDFGERRYLHLPTTDNEAPSLGLLAQGVDFIREEVGRGGRVYVHCWEGLGRGPTLAAAYLVAGGMTPEEAWALVRRGRPFIRPTETQRQRLTVFAAWYRPGRTEGRVDEVRGPGETPPGTPEEVAAEGIDGPT